MTFIEFARQYPNEESCKQLFRRYREQIGITCRRCGSCEHYWMASIESFQCKHCRHRTFLKSGTVLEYSKLPYHFWIYAMFLMTFTKKPISAKEMQRQLGSKRYEPVWQMMHKLRAVMGHRDHEYALKGIIEMDDALFKTHGNSPDHKTTTNKHGRGTPDKTKVLVMAQKENGSDDATAKKSKHKADTALKYIKMQVIQDSSSQTINQAAEGEIEQNSSVYSDNWTGFGKLKDVINYHYAETIKPKEASEKLPWVHTMIGNAKRQLDGIMHSMKSDYLQNYLNEFCYKTNRRYFESHTFDRLLMASVRHTWYGKSVRSYG